MTDTLADIAHRMVAPGKGILAADESTGSIEKRFASINIPNTEENRRDYREMLFSSREALKNYVSGVILFDETLRQSAKNGMRLADLITGAGAIPGIKVDKGPKPLPFTDGETVTEGLDGLAARVKEYVRPRRALCEMARGHRHRRRQAELQRHSCQCPGARPLCRDLPGRRHWYRWSNRKS